MDSRGYATAPAMPQFEILMCESARTGCRQSRKFSILKCALNGTWPRAESECLLTRSLPIDQIPATNELLGNTRRKN